MKRGTDFAPVPVSQRILTAGFTFFVLITVSTYTANMAAFLTTKNLGKTIDSFEVRGTKTSNTFSCVQNETPLLPAKNVGTAIDVVQLDTPPLLSPGERGSTPLPPYATNSHHPQYR